MELDTDAHHADPRSPRIELSTPYISFDARPGASPDPSFQTVEVRNAGGGFLHLGMIPRITYAEGQPGAWLSHSYLQSGLSPNALGARLMLYASTAHLLPGTYSASVTLVSNNADNSPAHLAVTVTVKGSGERQRHTIDRGDATA